MESKLLKLWLIKLKDKDGAVISYLNGQAKIEVGS